MPSLSTPNAAVLASAPPDWQLRRDAFGKLVLTLGNGTCHHAVVPVRAFPLQTPRQGIALVNTQGNEVVWIDDLATLAPAQQALIDAALNGREFIPEITRIVSVTSFSTPCTWNVDTDRGCTGFVLRGDEDIRRMGAQGQLLVSDIHGIQYLIRNQYALDAPSKKILDRFL